MKFQSRQKNILSTTCWIVLVLLQLANTFAFVRLVPAPAVQFGSKGISIGYQIPHKSWSSPMTTPSIPVTAATALSTTASSTTAVASSSNPKTMSNFAKKVTKIGMILFITTVALGLITSLSVIKFLGYLGIPETRRQRWALSTGQFIARWALRFIPFVKVDVIVDKDDEYRKHPQPAIWVCNHMSMLDVFILLASDLRMRGNKKRPIKVVYVSFLCVSLR